MMDCPVCNEHDGREYDEAEFDYQCENGSCPVELFSKDYEHIDPATKWRTENRDDYLENLVEKLEDRLDL